MPRLWCALLPLALSAGGLEPRPSAKDYPHHSSLPKATIAAEYHGRAFDSKAGGFVTQDFLVVEAALYPVQAPVEFSPSHFRLRLNGKKPELLPVTPGTVALAIRNPDHFEQRPRVVADAGVGGGTVIFGRPRRAERFPGDPEARIPTGGPSSEQAQTPDVLRSGAEAAEKLGLTRMDVHGAGAAGLVYFYWRGKHAKLKRIELVYDGPAGQATFRLR